MRKGQLINVGKMLRCRKCSRLVLRTRCVPYTTLSGTRSVQRLCWPCHNAVEKRRQLRDPEACRKYARAYKQRLADSGKLYAYHIKASYGLSVEQYNTLLLSQKGLCALCGRPETARSKSGKRPRPLAVDHDPRTGRIRGLLCFTHNVALGVLERLGVSKILRYLRHK